MRYDRARVQLGKISRFGLMELSRQRLRPLLGETAHQPCPRCSGTGFIRGTESTALHILRIIQEEAMKENSASVHAQVPVDVATFLLNEKRTEIASIEARMKVNVVLIPNIHLETPNYKVERLRHDDLNQEGVLPASYNLVEVPTEEPDLLGGQEVKAVRPQAAVQNVVPEQPAPMQAVAPAAAPTRPAEPAGEVPGIIHRLFGWLKIGETAQAPAPAPSTPAIAPAREERSESRRERDQGRGRDRQRVGGRGPRPQERGDRERRPVRGDGAERPERVERPERTERPERAARGERPERGERAGRPERGSQRGERTREERGPRPERAVQQGRRETHEDSRRDEHAHEAERRRQLEHGQALAAAEEAAPALAAAGEERPARSEQSERPRGDRERGGRRRGRGDRGERADRGERTPETAMAEPVPPSREQATVHEAAQPVQSPLDLQSPVSGPSEQAAQPSRAEPPVPAPEPQRAEPHVPAPEPQRAEPHVPAAQPQPAPTVDLERALKESGLQLVETRADARVEAATDEQAAFVPAKRQRRPAPREFNEPLVQVETGRREENPPA